MTRRELLNRLASGERIGAAAVPHDLFWSLFSERLIWHVEIVRRTGHLAPFVDEERTYLVEITDAGRASIAQDTP